MRTLLRFIQKYYTLLLFLLLETVAIFLMVEGNDFQRSWIFGINRQLSGRMYEKVEGLREFLHLKENNLVLTEENASLRNRIALLEKNQSLALVSFSNDSIGQYQYIPARVVRNNMYRQQNYLTLNRGRKQGVFRDMGVVSEQGIVGIVLESSRDYATVIPVINPDFRLSVKLQSNDYAGILKWQGDSPGHALLSEIPFHVELAEGDTIVTSGFSSIFPDNIPVGRIESYTLEKGNFYDIRVVLFTQFQQLHHVNVIRNFKRSEQLLLEQNTR